MKVLNLYSGLGGNRKHWQGVEVTAVEMQENIAEVYKQQYPNDTVVIGDAHEYLINNYEKAGNAWLCAVVRYEQWTYSRCCA
jgi:DNA (cytosine-5)-methyltransferase 1